MIHDKETIKDYYQDDTVARDYIDERFMRPLGQIQHRTQIKTINHIISFYHIDRVLEVACGPARLTSGIEGFKKGVAVDTSESMLNIARRNVSNPEKWHFINANAFDIKLNERFQLIYVFRFIRHFRLPERMKLYNKFHELLEDRGILIFDAVNYEKFALIRKMENKGQKLIYDKIYANSKSLENELFNAGYEVLTLKGLIYHFYIQAAISRISNKLNIDEVGMKVIHCFERFPFGRPLESIVISRKR
jgi:ubiquinone/menaquinone biosynthesis C-methylase UbiE